MAENLRHKAFRGVVWSAVERFSVQGVQFLMGIVIARLVLPSDYGLIAMLAIFQALGLVFVESGFYEALIQRQNRTEADFSTVFYFNMAVSLAVYALLWLAAPAIARFYEEPALVAVTRWSSLSIVLGGLTLVQRAKLTVSLDFKTQAKVSLAAVTVSGIAGVVTAWMGWGVLALVVQAVGNALVNNILLWHAVKWRPRGGFSRESFRTLFGFGSKLLVSGLMQTIYINLYSLILGRFFTSRQAGFYNRAFTIALFPSSNITKIITRAIYPVQCSIQHDDRLLAGSFAQYLRLSCFVVFPLMAGMAVLAEPMIDILLGAKWLPAARLITIIGLAYMWYPVMAINNHILNVKGRSDYYLRAEVIKKIAALAILAAAIAGAYFATGHALSWATLFGGVKIGDIRGVEIVCWSLVLYNVCDMIIIIAFARRVVDTGYRRQLRDLAPVILCTLLMSAAAWAPGLVIASAWGRLAAGFLAGAAVYLLSASVFCRRDLAALLSFVRR